MSKSLEKHRKNGCPGAARCTNARRLMVSAVRSAINYAFYAGVSKRTISRLQAVKGSLEGALRHAERVHAEELQGDKSGGGE